MTSELSMICDRLADINKALTIKGATVEHQGRTVPEDICIDIARAVQQAIDRATLAGESFKDAHTAALNYPPPAEAALP